MIIPILLPLRSLWTRYLTRLAQLARTAIFELGDGTHLLGGFLKARSNLPGLLPQNHNLSITIFQQERLTKRIENGIQRCRQEIVAASNVGITPPAIREIIKSYYPEYYGTDRHKIHVARGSYNDLDHALLARIYGATRLN